MGHSLVSETKEENMNIEFHDIEVGNTLAGRWRDIDYDYQAEEIIQEMALGHPDIVKFVLFDDEGERAIWEKEVNGKAVTLTWTAPRFTGQWRLNLPFTETDHARKYGRKV
jgi:hypothetical protein